MDAFQVSITSLYNSYKAHEDEICKFHLLKFLHLYGTRLSLLDLYKTFLSRSFSLEHMTTQLPNQEEWKRLNDYNGIGPQPFLGSANQKEMMNQMLNNLDITEDGDMIHYHFDRSEINGELIPSSALVLNQDIKVDYDDEAQRPYFAYFFAFMYGKTDFPKEFLEYHLNETFHDDPKRFNEFLMTINYASDQASEGYVDLLKSWIKEKVGVQFWQTLSGSENYTFDSLSGIVVSDTCLKYLIHELSSKRYLNASGGYVYSAKDRLAVAVALLETLISRQFTKKGIQWTIEAKVTFLKNAWGINVSTDSSNLRSLLPEYRQLFSFLAMAKVVDPDITP